jgi:tRNA pseudouridine38-40 synthase
MADAESPTPPMRRFKLTVAYDGYGFHGWQKQVDRETREPIRTVQGVLEQAAREVFKQPITLVGASRTDAGVHAIGQAAMFDAATRIPVERIPLALNARLPTTIDVRAAEVVRDGFQVIGDVTSKQYRYRIWNHAHRPLGLRAMVYHYWHPLDPTRMNEAARRLVGEHDFAAFAAAGHNRQTTVRTIHDCRVETPPIGPEVHVVVSSNGFLYNMVRIIAGTLIEIGRGHWPPERIDALLASGDRHAAGPTAPPQGLVLEWVRYD